MIIPYFSRFPFEQHLAIPINDYINNVDCDNNNADYLV